MARRSVVFRTSPELQKVLMKGLENFNSRVAIPHFKKPVDMVEYSTIVADFLDGQDLDRNIVVQPRKKAHVKGTGVLIPRFPF